MIKLKSLFRRGQSSTPPVPSSSKQTSQNSPSHSVGIKSSTSVSSLDRIAEPTSGSSSADLGATRKLSKNHNKQSSKDKLNDLLKVGSKEKLFDEKKELKKQQKQQQKQMQQVAQQSLNMHHQSSGSGEQQQRSERPHLNDFEPSAFNGIQDVSSSTFLFICPPTHCSLLPRMVFFLSNRKYHFQFKFSSLFLYMVEIAYAFIHWTLIELSNRLCNRILSDKK